MCLRRYVAGESHGDVSTGRQCALRDGKLTHEFICRDQVFVLKDGTGPSLLGTAKLNDLDPELYLRHLLERIADHPINRIHELLPGNLAAPSTQIT
jgi:hypothetical protein